MSFDFDAWRAARESGGPRVVEFAGRKWTIPAEMPWVVSDFYGLRSARNLSMATRALFGEPSCFDDDQQAVDQFSAFVALNLSTVEVAQGIIDGVIEGAYAPGGGAAPNSPGSTEPSEPTSPSSPETSSDTEDST